GVACDLLRESLRRPAVCSSHDRTRCLRRHEELAFRRRQAGDAPAAGDSVAGWSRRGLGAKGDSNETGTTKADDDSDRHLPRLLQRAAATSLSISRLLPAPADARADTRTRRACGLSVRSGAARECLEAVRAGLRGAAAQRIGPGVTGRRAR